MPIVAKHLIICNPNTKQLWMLDRSLPAIVPFDPPLDTTNPIGAEINYGPFCVWGAQTGELITVARRSLGNTMRFYHYEPSVDPSTWVDKAASNGTPFSIDGTSYQNVWTAGGDSYNVMQFNGTVWTLDAYLGGTRQKQVSVCGTDPDEVFVAANDQCWFRRSGAIGSGVWANHVSQFVTDTGLPTPSGPWQFEGVWARNKDEVYWLYKGPSNGLTHWIVKWTGPWPGTFQIVSTTAVNNYGISDTSFSMLAPNNAWWMQADPSWGAFHFVHYNGTTITRQVTPEHFLDFGCELKLTTPSYGDPAYGYAAGAWNSPERVVVWEFNGSVWSFLVSRTVGLNSQQTGTGFWYENDDFQPNITPIDPTDGEEDVDKDSSIKFRIDDDSGVNQSDVTISVRGFTIYSGGAVVRDGWEVSFVGSTLDWVVEVTAPTLERWKAEERVDVAVTAIDIATNVTEERWSFTAGRTLGLKIYPMIIGGVRRIDETNGRD